MSSNNIKYVKSSFDGRLPTYVPVLDTSKEIIMVDQQNLKIQIRLAVKDGELAFFKTVDNGDTWTSYTPAAAASSADSSTN